MTQSIINGGLNYGLQVGTAAGIIMLLITGIYLSPVNDTIKSFSIGTLGAVVGFIMLYFTQGEPKIFLVFYISLMTIGIYFNKQFILIYAIIFDLSISLFCIILPYLFFISTQNGGTSIYKVPKKKRKKLLFLLSD